MSTKQTEALKLALEALEKIAKTEYHVETPPIESLEEKMRRIARKIIPNLREALAEQPAQRTWVGLTDEEVDKWTPEIHSVIRAIEAKLREKNA